MALFLIMQRVLSWRGLGIHTGSPRWKVKVLRQNMLLISNFSEVGWISMGLSLVKFYSGNQI